MQPEELSSKINEISRRTESFIPAVKEQELIKRIGDIDSLSLTDPQFWLKQESKTLLKEQAKHKKFLESWHKLKQNGEDLLVLRELYKEGEIGVYGELEELAQKTEELAQSFELALILNGRHDINNAIITVHSGAGGTEANDWADMLLRMYNRYAEISGFSFELLDCLYGEEAGIKSVVFNIIGEYSYGYLKGESGVHRLVRISPFDSQNRRHTSFASVFVLPDIEDEPEVEINEADLRIDTYRSSGAGGQHVNTTDSAVRITHIPTGIAASSQTERSQHKNKAHAMKILSARLYEFEMSKLNSEREKLEAAKSDIAWGSQIRSYVMHPYKMVKDLRSRYETSNVEGVMNGELQEFIRAYLLFSAGIASPAGESSG
ncbi:MAG: peptide chain release factor 2 [Deferribacteraceae bacterium]|jgi:peptide chain release factor 2|nr:peptide chain release factor 2 [Deferribacteraceae bacterium]